MLSTGGRLGECIEWGILSEMRHVSLERQFPLWFLPADTRAVAAGKLCTCLWMCFLNSLLILFLLHVWCSFMEVKLSHCCSSHSFLSLPFDLFFSEATHPLLHLFLAFTFSAWSFSHPKNWTISELLWHFLPSPHIIWVWWFQAVSRSIKYVDFILEYFILRMHTPTVQKPKSCTPFDNTKTWYPQTVWLLWIFSAFLRSY